MDHVNSNAEIERLVEEHMASLYRFGFRLTGSAADAEDLVQETFLIAQKKLHQLRDPNSALPWLLTIMRSCRSKLRDRPNLTETVALDEVPDGKESEWTELDKEELLRTVDELPDEYREPLLMYYMHGLKYREIAEVVDCPIGTVMSRLARAKAYLRGRLTPQAVGRGSKAVTGEATHG